MGKPWITTSTVFQNIFKLIKLIKLVFVFAPSLISFVQIDFDNRHFFLENIITNSGIWFLWVYISGFKSEAEKYMATIKISEPYKKRSLTYVGDVFPMDIEEYAIIERNPKNVFMLNDTIIKSYLSAERICFTFTIEKL
jgi:hypothetical protein